MKSKARDKYRIDSHKLIYHVDRTSDWLAGKQVYPIYAEMRNIIPEPGGRFVDDLDLKERRRVVLIGDKVICEEPVGFHQQPGA